MDDGFRNLLDRHDATDRRQDGHETRIRALEEWRIAIKGGVQGAGISWKIGSALVGALIGALSVIGFQLAVVPKANPTPAHQTVKVESK
ncbi:hypothetical protein ACIGGE_16140 [Qipengyuania sp. NPDC077410]|uniref:hypothetical protein n=1 Tax=Qipengyuania sp. NPDC077410 TaxID=3364496 RepID=UPI0037CBC5EA